jgi:hypothetical protein
MNRLAIIADLQIRESLAFASVRFVGGRIAHRINGRKYQRGGPS